MECQQALTETIANNMANINTTAYKRSVARFQDMLYQTLGTPGAATADAEKAVGIEVGGGARVVSISKDFTQGTLVNSSSALDLAIEGEGFFEVLQGDGSSAYTRAGAFHLNASGQVVTANGNVVVGFPSIDTTATAIDIAKDGTVSVSVDGVSSQKGRLPLVRFVNNEGLKSLGYGLYAETESSGSPQKGNPGIGGFGEVAQYFIEGANVQIVKEMVDMIASQRAYELSAKSIKVADEMLRMASNLR